MNAKRLILYVIMIFLGTQLYLAWKRMYSPQPVTSASTASSTASTPTSDFTPGARLKSASPTSPTAPTAGTTPSSTVVTHSSVPGLAVSGRIVRVKTDLLNVEIDLQGGKLVSATLSKFPASLKQKDQPIQILQPDLDNYYIAQSGLTATKSLSPVTYESSKSTYTLLPGSNDLVVTLTGKTKDGLDITKTFTFKRNHYVVQVNYHLVNKGKTSWEGNLYFQILRRNVPVKRSFHSRSYDGAAISSPEKRYKKLTYRDLDSTPVNRDVQGGWIAMQQQYFLSAWVPPSNQQMHYYSMVRSGAQSGGDYPLYILGYLTSPISLAPGQQFTQSSQFYVGPEEAKRLNAIAPGLDLTIDYGWLWPISKLIFYVMAFIHTVVNNWGWSIVLVTLLIKILFYPFSDKTYKSMARMRVLQPRLAALKERYKDDRKGLGQATMTLYKEEKVNPMGGCLPMLIQVPVFIALYYVLIESVELRQAPFILWVHDLSVKDPYFILPLLMGVSMFLQQRLSPPPPDPAQAKIMMFLPVIFTVFFLTFPAGLVLYWLTNNCISMLHQWFVNKTYDAKKATELLKQKARRRKA